MKEKNRKRLNLINSNLIIRFETCFRSVRRTAMERLRKSFATVLSIIVINPIHFNHPPSLLYSPFSLSLPFHSLAATLVSPISTAVHNTTQGI